jgi:5,5'-dehydrodivanillate O-demethylase oxygenase subunit
MLSQEQNDRLTRVGPGTPCGELMRRYWQAVCPVGELTGSSPRKKRVRILGENLVIYRKDDGTFSAVAEQCPHRNASLYFGFIEPDGIRCCYHGWKYDGATGACVDRPFEKSAPPNGLRLTTYPVAELSGLLFIYMGPDPASAPLLPRWDVLARTDRPKFIRVMPRHACNWLQIHENTADSVHTYYLHGHMSKEMNLPTLSTGVFFYRPIESYDWSISEWGVEKSLVYGGDRPEIEIRPPLVFPNILRIPEGPVEAIHFRIPVDDEHTDIIWIGLMPPGSAEITDDRHIPYVIETDPPGLTVETVSLDTFYGQDRVVWETQGVIADRTKEVLGASDRGIVMFRRMLAEQIDRVANGDEPTVAVVRDPAKNVCIEFENQTRPWTADDERAAAVS